ncbi:nucleotidyltransferase domain-containing protein [Uliginosibacterium sp. H1]|uniref:nucleotidyltransferase domain-containing protein n=1 Tax=Uliginosibacterium sp. H1 TaxID=3114757 RepID=UPI002E18BBA1|nr:nucleotidyltransferase domain-containing protein [Uliginosibacterium sp. H1]
MTWLEGLCVRQCRTFAPESCSVECKYWNKNGFPYKLKFMEDVPKNLPWVELGDNARRQYIDAITAFDAWREAVKAALAVRGGMYWKAAGKTDYLIRTSVANAQKSLGPRSEETEAMYASFINRKRGAEERETSLRAAVQEHQRMNRALRVGRVPAIVVDVLNAIDAAGLSEYFTVVGTHSLYAYEAEAGVRFLDAGALATQDIDLLWDTRKRIRFVTTMKQRGASMINVLRKVDPSFTIVEGQTYTAMNKNGFEVDIIRREQAEDDAHPIQLTDAADDFWVVQARNATVLLNAPPFSSVVVSATGRMARMSTVSPVVFASFKHWLAEQASRDPLKRPRDIAQAKLVERLTEEYFPHLAR